METKPGKSKSSIPQYQRKGRGSVQQQKNVGKMKKILFIYKIKYGRRKVQIGENQQKKEKKSKKYLCFSWKEFHKQ